jgi:DNA-binding response OmpR family regulator
MKSNLKLNSVVPNILVVDDFLDNCELIQTYLKIYEDVNVIIATSGLAALEIYRKMEFALIILDIDMPKMDGFALAREMKILKRDDRTPLIYISANDKNSKLAAIGYELGAVDYILKPFDLQFLLQKVRVFLNLYQQRKILENEVAIKTTSENKLIKANEESQSILEDSHECICTFNVKGKIETINAAGVRLLQAENIEYIINIQFSQWVFKEDANIFSNCFNRVLNGETVLGKLRLQTFQNNIYWVQLSLSPKMEEGKIKRIVCLAIKIADSIPAN